MEESLVLSRSLVVKRIRNKLVYMGSYETYETRGFGYQRLSSDLNDNSLDEFSDSQLINYGVEAICLEKKVDQSVHVQFVSGLRTTLTQLYSYKKLVESAEELQKTVFDKKNDYHNELLINLWNSLLDKNVKDVSECHDWTLIGFQQEKDPCSDFRGMGLLGLIQLVFLSREHSPDARSMLSVSSHPVKGYSFAITGINMTQLVLSLLKDGSLRTHLFNESSSSDNHSLSLDDLHKVYSYVYIAFNRFWIRENPRDVMEFSFLREKFVNFLRNHLEDPEAHLLNWSCPVVEGV